MTIEIIQQKNKVFRKSSAYHPKNVESANLTRALRVTPKGFRKRKTVEKEQK